MAGLLVRIVVVVRDEWGESGEVEGGEKGSMGLRKGEVVWMFEEVWGIKEEVSL